MAEGFLPPVVAHLVADIREFQAKMGEAKGEMDALGAKGASTGAMVAKGLGTAALGIAGLAAGIAGIGIASAINYQEAMAKVGGQLGLTEEQTKKLGDSFFKTARHSEYSATDLAKAYEGVAGQVAQLSGGNDVTASSTEVLRASMELATAKGIDLSTAVSAVVGNMRTFQTPTADAADTMALLYNTSSATGISIDSLNSILGRMNAAVAGVKPPASDLAGLLLDLGQHGVTGTRAIGSVSNAIAGMLDPAFQAKATAAGLNLQVYDTTGKFVGMRNIIGQLQPQLAGLSQEQQIATLSNAGLGSSAEKLLPTILAGTTAFDNATTAVQNHDKAQGAAEAAGSTFKGQLEKVKSAAQDAATALGNILMPGVTKALEWFAGPGADHLRHFINGISGKGHSTDWMHQAGADLRAWAGDVKAAFAAIKSAWDLVPGPLKPFVVGTLGGAIVGAKVGGLPGAVAGGVAGGTAGGVAGASDKGNGFWGQLGAGVAAGATAGLGVGLLSGPFAEIGVPAGVIGGAVIGGVSSLVSQGLDALFGGGSPAGAAEHPAATPAAGVGNAQGGAMVAAMNSSLTAIATNTAGAATTLQTSDGRLERHGGHLERIDTYNVFVSQHTREANTHLQDIARAVKGKDKINVKVRLV
jgi:TP901 family phage tail tape measure protein